MIERTEASDGTLYCSRRDTILGVERCFTCEYAVVVRGQVACVYDDVVPRLRGTEAAGSSLGRLRPSRG